MRRSVLGVGVAIAVLSGGCGLNQTSITDEWPQMPALQAFAPKAEACHAMVAASVDSKTYRPIDCTGKHLVQTLHVGTLTGEAAALAAPPELSSAAAGPAYAECDRGVKARLGGKDWRDYRLDLVVYLPTAKAWEGGARWVRCDAAVPRDLARSSHDDLVELQGPLSPAVLETLVLGCFAYKSAPNASLTGVACTQPHNAEYVGSDTMPAGTKYPESEADWDKLHEKCFARAAAFVGVARSALTTGVSSWVEEEERWNGGDRSIRCYLWLDDETMSASAKNSRGLGLP